MTDSRYEIVTHIWYKGEPISFVATSGTNSFVLFTEYLNNWIRGMRIELENNDSVTDIHMVACTPNERHELRFNWVKGEIQVREIHPDVDLGPSVDDLCALINL